MKKIKDKETALSLFEEAAIKHAEATKQGDYKTCNKSYKIISKAIMFLKEHNEITSLSKFLNYSSVGVRVWAAIFLLPVEEIKATNTLEQIESEKGFFSFEAKMTLSEWRKGNLKL
jgi:hypothetical protein